MWLSRHLYYEPFGVSRESPPLSTSPLEWLRHNHRGMDGNLKTGTQDNDKKYTKKDLEPRRLPHFLLVTTGLEPGPLASQAAELASALTSLGVCVRTVHDKSTHHFTVISNFGQYRTQVDELRTLEDVCVDFINGFTWFLHLLRFVATHSPILSTTHTIVNVSVSYQGFLYMLYKSPWSYTQLVSTFEINILFHSVFLF